MNETLINKKFRLLLFFAVTFVMISILADFVISRFGGLPEPLDQLTLIDYFLIILVVPVVETLVFQKLPIDYALKKEYKNRFVLIIGTGLVFTLFHYKGFLLSIPILISGIYLSYIYLRLKEEEYYPFIGTIFCHMLLNVVVLLSKHYF